MNDDVGERHVSCCSKNNASIIGAGIGFGKRQKMKGNLFSKEYVWGYIRYGAIAAAGYVTTALVFILHTYFKDTWWLNVGNIFFMMTIFIYICNINDYVTPGTAIQAVISGSLATLAGILLSCTLLGAITLSIPLPPLQGTPANNVADKENGLLWMVFMNAMIVNFSCGFFISLITAFAVKRVRRNEKESKNK